MRGADRDSSVARRLAGRRDIDVRPVHVDPGEIDRGANGCQVLVGELRNVASGGGEVAVGVPALQHDGQEWGVELAAAVSAALTYSGVPMTGTAAAILGETDPRIGSAASADSLHRQTVAQHGMVADLVQPGRGELQLGGHP